MCEVFFDIGLNLLLLNGCTGIENVTQEWMSSQEVVRRTFSRYPSDRSPRFLLRDRDAVSVLRWMRVVGEILYAECLDRLVLLHEVVASPALVALQFLFPLRDPLFGRLLHVCNARI